MRIYAALIASCLLASLSLAEDRWVRKDPSFKSFEPYRSIKRKFDELSVEELTKKIVSARTALAQQNISNSERRLKSFEVVCGEVTRVAKNGQGWSWLRKDFATISKCFQEINKVDCLESTYYSFFLGAYYNMTAPSYIPVAEVLHKHYPNDLYLMYTLTACYQPQADRTHESKAWALVEKMKSIDRNNVRTIRAEGVFYYMLQLKTHDSTHRQIAIDRFQQVLKQYDASSDTYKLLRSQIAELSGN